MPKEATMTGAPLLYTPPAVNTQNVLYGVGLVYTSPVGTALPSDQNLGVGSSWTGGGWAYIGATDAGVSLTYNPSTVDISIEEQPTPVATLVDKATAEVTFDFNEETLANINIAYGGASTIAVTAPGASQPGKSVLSLSVNITQLACAVVGKNQLGFARVLSIPAIMSVGQVKTDYRRSANQRMYPTTFSSVCPFDEIQWIDLTSLATS
jgi:hypothetical protein